MGVCRITIDEIREYLSTDYINFKNTFKNSVENKNSSLMNTINTYILNNNGKELRPLITLLAGRIFSKGELSQITYRIAAVVEIIHNATLMHDDVADGSKFRRGSLTVNSKYSSAAAVLMGDYWLSRALFTLLSDKNIEILSCFTNAMEQMSEGEIFQMEKADRLDTTLEDYYNIITKKTAALFMASVKAVAVAHKVSEEYLKAIVSYAKYIGLAFQMRDDILDFSSQSNTGKTSGLDIKERKITLPLLGAFEKMPHKKADIIAKMSKISLDNNNEKMVEEIVSFVKENYGIEYAQKILEEETKMAIDSLSILPESKDKEMLVSFANTLSIREY